MGVVGQESFHHTCTRMRTLSSRYHYASACRILGSIYCEASTWASVYGDKPRTAIADLYSSLRFHAPSGFRPRTARHAVNRHGVPAPVVNTAERPRCRPQSRDSCVHHAASSLNIRSQVRQDRRRVEASSPRRYVNVQYSVRFHFVAACVHRQR